MQGGIDNNFNRSTTRRRSRDVVAEFLRLFTICIAFFATTATPAAAQDALGPTPDTFTPARSLTEDRTLPVPGARAGIGQPSNPSDPSSASSTTTPISGGWLRVIGATALVVGLIVVAGTVLKRAAGASGAIHNGSRSPSGILQVLGRYPIGSGQQLLLLKADSRVILLGQTPAGLRRSGALTTLAEFVDPEDVASILMKVRDAEGESVDARFRELVASFGANTNDIADDPTASLRTQRSRGRGGDRAELLDESRAFGAGIFSRRAGGLGGGR